MKPLNFDVSSNSVMQKPRKFRFPQRTPSSRAEFSVPEQIKNSSEKNRNFLIALTSLLTYVLIAASSIPDINFVLPEAALRLPLLAIDVPFIHFCLVAPVLVIAIHIDMLLNLVAHNQKLTAWRNSGDGIKPEQIQPFIFDLATLQPAHGNDVHPVVWFLVRGAFRAISQFLAFWYAPVVLVFLSWWFSARQDWAISLWHALLAMVDIAATLLVARMLRAKGTLRSRLRGALSWTTHSVLVLAFACCSFASPVVLIFLESPAGLDIWLKAEEAKNIGYGVWTSTTTPEQHPLDVGYDPSQEGEEGKMSPSSWMAEPNEGAHPNYKDVGWSTTVGGNWNGGSVGSDVRFVSALVRQLLEAIPDSPTSFLPRRLDVSHEREFRRVPAQALKLRQFEAAVDERDAWHQLGLESQSIDLSRRRFRFANFRGAQLSYANLTNARLDGAILEAANFSHAKLDNASFRKVQAGKMVAQGTTGQSVEFLGANLAESSWLAAALPGANFSGANLKSARFQGGQFWNARFIGATLAHAEFLNVSLSWADFSSSEASDTNFGHSELKQANFSRANLYRSSFNHTDASGGRFDLAMIQATSWRGAAMKGGVSDQKFPFATPGRVFFRRETGQRLTVDEVQNLRRTRKIDFRDLHDRTACAASTNDQALLFLRSRHQMSDQPVSGRCSQLLGPLRTDVSLPTVSDASLYSSNLAASLCAKGKTTPDTDMGVLRWVAALSLNRYLENGRLVHTSPFLQSDVFVTRLRAAECTELNQRISAGTADQDDNVRRWLKDGG